MNAHSQNIREMTEPWKRGRGLPGVKEKARGLSVVMRGSRRDCGDGRCGCDTELSFCKCPFWEACAKVHVFFFHNCMGINCLKIKSFIFKSVVCRVPLSTEDIFYLNVQLALWELWLELRGRKH